LFHFTKRQTEWVNLRQSLKVEKINPVIRKPQKKPEVKYDINEILNKAEECLDEYKFELAQKFCERALQIDENNIRALQLTAGLLLDMGEVESAQNCLGRAIHLEPDSGHSKYLSLAQLMTGAQSRDMCRKAIELINSKISSLPAADESLAELRRDLSNALISISEIYMTDLCDEEEAETESMRCIEEAIQADPSNPEAFQAKANYGLVVGNVEDAKTAINKSLDLWLPQHLKFLEDGSGKETTLTIEFRNSTVKMLLDLEDFDNAIKILDALVEEDDTDMNTWYLLGWTNFLRCKTESEYTGNARHYLQKAEEVNKRYPTEDEDLVEHIKSLLDELGEDDATESNDAVKILKNATVDQTADIFDKEAEEEEEESDDEENMQE